MAMPAACPLRTNQQDSQPSAELVALQPRVLLRQLLGLLAQHASLIALTRVEEEHHWLLLCKIGERQAPSIRPLEHSVVQIWYSACGTHNLCIGQRQSVPPHR